MKFVYCLYNRQHFKLKGVIAVLRRISGLAVKNDRGPNIVLLSLQKDRS